MDIMIVQQVTINGGSISPSLVSKSSYMCLPEILKTPPSPRCPSLLFPLGYFTVILRVDYKERYFQGNLRNVLHMCTHAHTLVPVQDAIVIIPSMTTPN